jgi:hypothetical protein
VVFTFNLHAKESFSFPEDLRRDAGGMNAGCWEPEQGDLSGYAPGMKCSAASSRKRQCGAGFKPI